jgi:MYXO-CTERM domain-containing protein
MLRRRALVAALAALSVGATASADDTWSNPFPGVRRLLRVTASQHIDALLVDLCAPGVSVRVTAPSERTRTVPAFGALVGAQAAVNGGFYNTANQAQTDGFVLHDGASWGGTDHDYTGPIAFGDGRADLVPHERVEGPQPWMREAVSGHPTLVVDGAARDNSGDTGLCGRNPRTAAGFTADRRTLILAVVDGRAAPSRVGMTCNELAALMIDLGARDALNLDGGGSSTMWLAGAGVLNHPTDGSPRTVSNHLALYARGSGAAPHCPPPAYRATYVMQTFPLAVTTLDLAPGETSTGYLEMRNTGTATWTPARTRLGTTQPRDRSSVVAGPDWLAPNRAAAIDRTVAPGATGRFNFTLRAPTAAGEYAEYFNLVEEGVTWFSDPGQGGPADNVIQVRVRTVPRPDAGVMAMDAGMPVVDAGVPTVDRPTVDVPMPRDLGVERDLGAVTVDVPGDDGTATNDVGTVDGAVADDADGPLIGETAGCDCDAGRGGSRGVAGLWALALAAVARRRRRLTRAA